MGKREKRAGNAPVVNSIPVIAFLGALAAMASCAAILAGAVLFGDARAVLSSGWLPLAGLSSLLVLLVAHRTLARRIPVKPI